MRLFNRLLNLAMRSLAGSLWPMLYAQRAAAGRHITVMNPEQTASSRNRPRLVFYHLPRTAGLALIYDVLFPNCSWWRRCYVNFDSKMTPQNHAHEPRSWPSWRRRQVHLLAGHMPFGFQEHFPGKSECFTFLRDPIARAVSDYYFCRRDPANPAFAAANKLSLTEFVEGDYSYVRNCYARWLSNETYGARFATEEEMFQTAMENLAQVSLIGITEQFDLSVERLCARYGLTAYRPREAHKNAFTPDGRQLSEEELCLLQRHNALDVAIYQQCVSRFEIESRSPGALKDPPSPYGQPFRPLASAAPVPPQS